MAPTVGEEFGIAPSPRASVHELWQVSDEDVERRLRKLRKRGEGDVVGAKRNKKRRQRKQREFHCEQCGVSFTRASDMCRHKRRAHSDENAPPPLHACTFPGCMRTFTTPANRNRHMRNVHEKRKQHECSFVGGSVRCNKRFAQLSDLKRHMLTHEDKRPHACATCGRSFRQRSHLKMHSALHLDEKEAKEPRAELSRKRKRTSSPDSVSN